MAHPTKVQLFLSNTEFKNKRRLFTYFDHVAILFIKLFSESLSLLRAVNGLKHRTGNIERIPATQHKSMSSQENLRAYEIYDDNPSCESRDGDHEHIIVINEAWTVVLANCLLMFMFVSAFAVLLSTSTSCFCTTEATCFTQQ